jgi:hypothetical protein
MSKNLEITPKKVTRNNLASRLLDFKKVKAKKGPLKEEEIAEALIAFKGLQYLAAEALGVTDGRVSQMINASPYLLAVREMLLERRLDIAEYNLAELTEEKDLGSIIWFLKTQGKKRGYVEGEKANNTQTTEETQIAIAAIKDLNAPNRVQPQSSEISGRGNSST